MAKLPQGVRKKESKKGNVFFEKRFTVNGQRYSVYGATVKEVQEKEQERREEIRNDINPNSRNMTVDKYFQDFIERKKTRVKPNTIYSYTNIYTYYIKPHIGREKVCKVTPQMIERIMSKSKTMRGENCSGSLANYILTILRIMFSDAVRKKVIITSPCNGIEKVKDERVPVTKTKHRALTSEEQEAFFEAAKGSFYYNLFVFMVNTGCRIGEAAALEWKDIDWNNKCFEVSKTLTKAENGKVTTGTPKSKAGVRTIELNEDAIKALNNQRKEIVGYGWKPIIFHSTSGGYIINTSVNKEIKSIIDSAGLNIPIFSSHAFRDTCATNLIAAGVPLPNVQKILGHANINQTSKYNNPTKEHNVDAMKRIERAVM